MENGRIQGTLGIWNGLGQTGYRLVFVPYLKRIKPLCEIVTGDEELEHYLLATGFEPDVARGWLKQVRTLKSVSIESVLLSGEFLNSRSRQPKESTSERRNRLLASLHNILPFVSKS